MNGPIKGYITLQESAALLGVSRQTVTRRALAAERSTDSLDGNLDSLDSSLDSKPASIVHGKKRYLSMDWVLAELDKAEPVNDQADSSGQSADSKRTVADSSADKILQLEMDLLAAQVEAAALRATVKAQEAHIDSLQRALDGEQALHMASLQKRLTAPGRGFMDWIRRKTKGTE